MISVILIWLYMLITTFTVGYGVLRVITRHIPYHAHERMNSFNNLRDKPGGNVYQIRYADAYFMCGIVCVTVYAQFFSLFGGVGLAANGMLCAACVLIVWLDRAAFGNVIRGLFFDRKEEISRRGGLRICLLLFLFLLFSYGTSRGMIHYDTGLYHAQSIRWIEEYGVVKGLGNLHCRLAYNSSSFALSALYSMAFLGGRSYHCCAGFLAFLLTAVCLEVVGHLCAGKLHVSDFARVMGLYYLVNIFDEMISPASDYFMVLTAFYIVIRWLDLLELEERETLPYALLCILGVFLMTVKLSAALILLLTLWPACFLLRDKRWREVLVYLCLGLVTALPYFIRNVVISGWLVYPFTQIDFFPVRWKIPKGIADYDAREIQVWGRGYADVARYDISMGEWLPDWFRSLSGSDRAFVLLAVLSVCALLLYGMGMVFKWWRRRWDILLVQLAVAASFLFWLCTSPLIRYGCVYVYLTPAVVFGGIYEAVFDLGKKRERSGQDMDQSGVGLPKPKGRILICLAVQRAAVVLIALLLVYKGFALGREIVRSHTNDYWLVQKDYENYETYPYEIAGCVFYLPVEGDQTGYKSFPAAPSVPQITLRGEGLKDGFENTCLDIP